MRGSGHINLQPRNLAVPIIVIVVVFFVAGSAIVNSTRDFYYQHVEEESRRLAISYARSLAIATEATEIVDSLLAKKLLAAGQVVAAELDHSHPRLAELATALEVDEIYSYSPQGEILSSNTGLYIGWQATPGHPVHDFMISGRDHLVEGIRQDTESDNHLKYGYFRMPDQRFVQIGVLAETVHEFLGKFEVPRLLEQMRQDQWVSCARFIDAELQLVATCTYDHLGGTNLIEQARDEIVAGREYITSTDLNGQPAYVIMLPVVVEGERIGTLMLAHDLTTTHALIRRVSQVGVVALLFMFSVMIALIYVSHKRNSDLVQSYYFDHLTGLPNRSYFNRFMQQQLELAAGDHRGALLLIECHLDLLNLTFGPQYGDAVLNECAQQLARACGPDQRLFRLAGGRLALYIESYSEQDELIGICEQVMESLRGLLQARSAEMTIGVVEIGDECLSPEKAIKRAAIAASYARREQAGGYRFFDRKMEDDLLRESVIERELHIAVDKQDEAVICLHYQPILDAQSNRVAGYEALARMNSQELGAVSPAEFIPVAERTRLIVPLGRMIVSQAFKFLKALQGQGFRDVKVFVNVSAVQLLSDDFVQDIKQTAEQVGVPTGGLVLEITESLLLENYEVTNRKLSELQSLGILVAIDDYGTGYSSLARGRELRVNCIKIDKSFIDHLLLQQPERMIAGTIIAMAHRMGHSVVAEGVESGQQLEYLRRHGCDLVQGYHFSKPLPPAEALEFLKRHNQ
ncbi:MAG: putative bifunctional diguanylate cyclase/phosphodiesterase [Bacillota bacterium]